MNLAAGSLVAAVVLLGGLRITPPPLRLLMLAPPRPGAPASHRTHALTVVAHVTAFGGLALVGGPVLCATGIAACVVWRRLVPVRRQRRTRAAIAGAFPDFIDLLVLTVKAGCTPLQALESLGSTIDTVLRGAVHEVIQQVARGGRFADAVGEFPRRLGPIAQPLADALALSDRYGTPLAVALNRLADEARAHRRRHAEAAARQLPVRLSFPLVGCTLPSFVLLTIVPLMAGTLSSFGGLAP